MRHDFRDCSGNLAAAQRSGAGAARKPKEEAPEEEAELISLEEADAEKQDKKAPAEDTIIEEEEDTDVSDIIGADIEDEKET